VTIPDRLLLDLTVEVDLQVEHSGYKFDLKGSGPEYRARFPSLFSALHFALALWPIRKLAPKGLVLRLECIGMSYRYRT
jgi:hypothetical protein